VLCLVWAKWHRSGRVVTEFGQPWVTRQTSQNGEQRTALLTALISQEFEIAKCLLSRGHSLKLALCEWEYERRGAASNGRRGKKFDELLLKNPPARIEPIGKLSYLRDLSLSATPDIVLASRAAVTTRKIQKDAESDIEDEDAERTDDMHSLVFRQTPDLLLIHARVWFSTAAGNADRCLGDSAIFLASRAGQMDIVDILLSRRASFDIEADFDYMRCLLYDIAYAKPVYTGVDKQEAVIRQTVDVIRLTEAAWRKQIVPLDEHPLYKAVERGKYTLVKALLKDVRGSESFIGSALLREQTAVLEHSQSRLTRDGFSVLSKAVHMGHYGIVKILLKAGAAPLYTEIYTGDAINLQTFGSGLYFFRVLPVLLSKLGDFIRGSFEFLLRLLGYRGYQRIHPVESSEHTDDIEKNMRTTDATTQKMEGSSSKKMNIPVTAMTVSEAPVSTTDISSNNDTSRYRKQVLTAHQLALLRVERELRLQQELEKVDAQAVGRRSWGIGTVLKSTAAAKSATQKINSSSASFGHISELLPKARTKQGIAKDMLHLINEENSASSWRKAWISTYAIKKSFAYAMFLIFFTFTAIVASQLDADKYVFNSLTAAKVMGNAIPFDESSLDIKPWMNLGTTSDFYTFLTTTFLDNIYPSGLSDGWLDEHNRVIGGIRLFQQRDTSFCEHSDSELWRRLTPTKGSADTTSCFNYNINDRTGFGYDIILPGMQQNLSLVHDVLSNLSAYNWIDGATVSVSVEYVVGNIEDELLQLASLEMTFPSSGDTKPTSTFIVLPANAVGSPGWTDFLVMIIGLLFSLFVVAELIEMSRSATLWEYIQDGWNIFEVVVGIISVTWACLLMRARYTAFFKLDDFSLAAASDVPIFLDLWLEGRRYLLCEFLASAALVGAYFRVVKYLQFLPFIGPDMISLISTLLSVRVLTFLIFVLFMVISLGVGMYARFGGYTLEFASFGNSLFSMFYTLLGDDLFETMVGGGREKLLQPDISSGTGILFFLLVSFVFSLILSNLFINVTGNVYDEAHQTSTQSWTENVDAIMIEDVCQSALARPKKNVYQRQWRRLLAYLKIRKLSDEEAHKSSHYAEDWTKVVKMKTKLENSLKDTYKKVPFAFDEVVVTGLTIEQKSRSARAASTIQARSTRTTADESTPPPSVLHLHAAYWSRHELLREFEKQRAQITKQLKECDDHLNALGVDISRSASDAMASNSPLTSELILPDISDDVLESYDLEKASEKDSS
jgi:hypothetical protein